MTRDAPCVFDAEMLSEGTRACAVHDCFCPWSESQLAWCCAESGHVIGYPPGATSPEKALTLQVIQRRYGVSLEGPLPIRLPAGRSDLPHLCRALGVTRGAEIGVWKGAFSEEFCRAMPDVEWFAVDTWAPYAEYRERKNDASAIAKAYEKAKARLGRYRCTILRASSREAAAQIPDASLDVVYIDANHEADFVRADLEAWTPKLRPGGLMAGHDYRVPPKEKAFIQVKAAVDRYVAEAQIAPWFVLTADRSPSFLWVV